MENDCEDMGHSYAAHLLGTQFTNNKKELLGKLLTWFSAFKCAN